LQHRVLRRPGRQLLLFFAASGLGLFFTKRSDSFTLASTPKVIAEPGVVEFSEQRILATSKRPDGKGYARVSTGWPAFAYASLLIVSLHSISTARNRSVLPKRCRRGVPVSLSSMAGHHFETLPSQDSNQATPWVGAQTTAATPCTCSSFLLPDVDEVGGTPAQLLQSKFVPMLTMTHHVESNAAHRCTKLACHFVGHQRKHGPSARRRYQRTATRATRRQIGANFLPRQPQPMLPVPYDPSRVRVQIQDVLLASSSCTKSASDRDAKLTAAKSEISQFQTHYISGNGSASVDH